MVDGVLTEPVYLRDRIVLPEGAAVRGVVTDYQNVDKTTRAQALLNGDVTPLHQPVISFDLIHTPNGDVSIHSRAVVRDTEVVRFDAATSHPGVIQRAKAFVRDRINSARDAAFAPGKKDRALRLLYGQLPYHPQRIWSGTQFVADLTEAATFNVPAETPLPLASSQALTDSSQIQVTARLLTSLSSDAAHNGDNVVAMVTKPVITPQHELLFPEGTELHGTVLRAKPSKSFGRNGQLRFTFSDLQLAGRPEEHVHGMLAGASGEKSQNITVDQEGGIKSNPDKNRFVAPAVLGLLTFVGQTEDRDGSGLGRQTVASNGFGIIARVVALTLNDRRVAIGFGSYSFAKSVYFRFLTRGHAVVFPKDTLVEVSLTNR
ncbi:hypothetical protein [Silvibacterium acidisoli]|uniref:hypothetical protein n=1 Tax=Acidobacteriaceae bacterium ZG23-2 TaxID=2883246 RepID=UPI00406D1A10